MPVDPAVFGGRVKPRALGNLFLSLICVCVLRFSLPLSRVSARLSRAGAEDFWPCTCFFAFVHSLLLRRPLLVSLFFPIPLRSNHPERSATSRSI